jgi:hypothetical protein
MRLVPSGSGVLRFAIACAGLLGLLLAVDALVIFLFLLLAALAGGSPMNPYAGVVAFLVIPALAAIGLGAAWGAYHAWRATAPAQVSQEVSVPAVGRS